MLTVTNMTKKKISIIIISIIGLYVLSGCNGFDAAWYQNQTNSTPKKTQAKQVDVVINIPNAANDPFSKPKNNNKDANGFSADVFENWLLTAKFDDKNVPSYKFNTSGSKWSLKKGNDQKIDEYSYSGADSSAGSNSITDMKYFMYKKLSPFYSPSNGYNKAPHSTRLERFYFYRHTGKGGGIAPLNNYLVAIDSYSKLVFAYAVPTQTKNVLGNNMPIAWGPVDTETIIDGANYKFYEFDPVGIVKADGSVEVYQWFKDNMAKANYHPIMGDFSREVATYGKAGRSPYIGKDSQTASILPRVDGKLTVKLVSLENVDFYDNGSEESQFMYEFTSSFANGVVKDKKKDLLIKHKSLTDNWFGLPNEAKHLKVGKTLYFDASNSNNDLAKATKEYFISSQKSLNLDLDADLREVDVFNLKSLTPKNKTMVSFKYDRKKSAWVVNDNLAVENAEGVKLDFDKEFNLSKQDGTKDFVITITKDNASKDKQGKGNLKLTYRLGWEELQEISEIKGDLKIELVSLENTNFKDGFGDHGNFDGTDSPEFLYKFTSLYSDGNLTIEKIHAEDTQGFSALPAKFKHLKVGDIKFFDGEQNNADKNKEKIEDKDAKNSQNADIKSLQVFAINGKYNLNFKLANTLFEVDIANFNKLLEIGNSDISFNYDREKHLWKLLSNSKTLPNTEVSYDKNFTLSAGENSKEFVIKIKEKTDGELKLTYRLSWLVK